MSDIAFVSLLRRGLGALVLWCAPRWRKSYARSLALRQTALRSPEESTPQPPPATLSRPPNAAHPSGVADHRCPQAAPRGVYEGPPQNDPPELTARRLCLAPSLHPASHAHPWRCSLSHDSVNTPSTSSSSTNVSGHATAVATDRCKQDT